jgi:hypothetical protein
MISINKIPNYFRFLDIKIKISMCTIGPQFPAHALLHKFSKLHLGPNILIEWAKSANLGGLHLSLAVLHVRLVVDLVHLHIVELRK